jgi:hypothetical protein
VGGPGGTHAGRVVERGAGGSRRATRHCDAPKGALSGGGALQIGTEPEPHHGARASRFCGRARRRPVQRPLRRQCGEAHQRSERQSRIISADSSFSRPARTPLNSGACQAPVQASLSDPRAACASRRRALHACAQPETRVWDFRLARASLVRVMLPTTVEGDWEILVVARKSRPTLPLARGTMIRAWE